MIFIFYLILFNTGMIFAITQASTKILTASVLQTRGENRSKPIWTRHLVKTRNRSIYLAVTEEHGAAEP